MLRMLIDIFFQAIVASDVNFNIVTRFAAYSDGYHTWLPKHCVANRRLSFSTSEWCQELLPRAQQAQWHRRAQSKLVRGKKNAIGIMELPMMRCYAPCQNE